MRSLFFLSLVVMLSCRDRAVLGANGELRVQPERLDFSSVWVGHRAVSSLVLQNAGRRSIEVAVRASPPFEVTSHVVVTGGDFSEIEVGLFVHEVGAVDGVLTLSAEGQRFEVPLHADARSIPSCVARDCHVVTFDASTGTCVERVGNEGAACGREDACIINGFCRAGECVGEVRDCDDDDVCTVDTCNAMKGCQHRARECAAPSNPCEAAVCRAGIGCDVVPVVDGASCGSNDCVTANVCISGACVERPAPNGSQCAPPTGCRGASTCSSGVCVVGAPVVQRPAWRYVPPEERSLSYLGHVDNDGNAYAVETWMIDDTGEQSALKTDLLSFSPTGSLRFRTNVTFACDACRSGVDFAIDTPGRRLFVKVRRELIAFSLTDGAELWRVDVTVGLPVYEPLPSGLGSFSVNAPLLVGSDGVAVPMMEGVSDHHGYVRTYDRVSGARLWDFHRKGHLYAPGVTGNGELWLSTADCWAPNGDMARVAPDGTVLKSRFIAWAPSIYGERSAYGHFDGKQQRLDDAFDFHDLTPALGVPYVSGPSLVSGEQYVFADAQHRRLVSVNLATNTRVETSESRDVAAFRLLRSGAIAWAGQSGDGGYIRAIDADGGSLYDCDVTDAPNASLSFVQGRLYAGSNGALVVYETPGLDAAPRGWVGERGSPERGGRAR